MQIIRRLAISAYGMHMADQIALVSVPLIAVLAFGAKAEVIGILVACQSMAHLLGSLPFGLMIDRVQAKFLIVTAAVISVLGFASAAASVNLGSVVWFGVAVTFAGFGIVLFVLTNLSILPKIANADEIAGANSQLEIPRALSSFAAPLVVGFIITEEASNFIFFAASLSALFALCFIIKVPRFPVPEYRQDGMIRRVLEGGAFVFRHDLLLPITLCAIFWNMAFPALLVVLLPIIVEVYSLDPGTFGIALSSFGLAAIAGSWAAGRFSTRIPPNIILLFGPGSSVVASAILLLIPREGPAIAVYAAFFLLGFGPSMWLVAQNSVRQLVTPGFLLGRVNAVIQTAIYGVRPVGALLGGMLAGVISPHAGLTFVVLAFACSFASALFTRLRTVRRYTDLQPAMGA
ncbi:MFS transporter [Pelagibacterium lentulum]|uniref:MFS transporter n=1 Tax=Pelagibacterium lentulum TaxID=2029865 RepID=A0A916RNP3_9HYPH|nr:MFS transporter [Pelagibacterium lentulum]GGA62724.1 MFS transporter [Pelagibacterium lentulum]